jgi:threonyl-tRNA synthetase
MNPEDFSLDEIRHSASHILAVAVKRIFPEAKLGIGPAIENGFYYDFDLPRTLTPEDLKTIEKEMKKIIKSKIPFENISLSRAESLKMMEDQKQEYKCELINDLDSNEFSFYKNEDFIDLCKGPHIRHAGQIKAFKLLRVAGAYWRGSEENKMLQRIYGTAFYTKEDLKDYLHKLEEAKKRDHRIIGKQLDLFSLNDDIGAGLVLWHPKGARIRNIIEEYWKKEHYRNGYELLYTPHLGKANLWQTSGHLDFYNENMYSPMDVDKHDYFIRPMNCPFHILIYKNKQRSYRELPIRYAELGTVYRYERSGALHGLLRVRGFTQDDAHIICTPEQAEEEILAVIKMCLNMLKVFGFEKFKIFLSTKPEKYVGEDEDWIAAESALRSALEVIKLPYEVDNGGGAFYGPKIDIKIEDAIGREWQCSTIQFDFNLSERFDMTYISSNGQKQRPFMIHRALLGAIERFFGVLLEHYSGKLPLWLSPVQVKLLSVNESIISYAKDVEQKLQSIDMRAEIDFSDEKLGYKIRQSIAERVPYMVILGEKEAESGTVSVRSRDNGDLGVLKIDEFVDLLIDANKQALSKADLC